MADVKAALESSTTPQADAGPSVAVLPFANMSADKENEYFGDGLAEEIINALAHIQGLKVTARTSAFAFRGKEQDIRTIAEALDVGAILEGSVRRSGNRLRVTAQLINAADGYHLWSERYDREMADVFAIQEEIAEAIAAALRVTLSTDRSAPRRPTANLDAYEAYLKARYYQWRLLPESAARSKAYYEEALRLDPTLASAHVGLAHYFLALAAFSAIPTHEAMPKVPEGALNALSIDPLLPEAHALLGVVAGVYDYDWNEAGRRFQLAMAHDPVPPDVRLWYGVFYLGPLGRAQEAIAQHKTILRADPFNLTFLNALAEGYASDEQWEECGATAKHMIEVDPGYFVGHIFMTMVSAVGGRWPDAFKHFQRVCALAGYSAHSFGDIFTVLASKGGDPDAAALLLADERGRPVPLPGLAQFQMLCGDMARAADLMTEAMPERHMMVARNLGFKRWRSNPRWPELALKINLPA